MAELCAVLGLVSPCLLLALATCTPRVPANIEIDEPPTGAPEANALVREAPGADFDVEVALDGAEQALLAIHDLRTRPRPQPYDHGEMYSYLPDQGLRALYYYGTVANISLWKVGSLFETTVFIDGPHGDHPDFLADSFGAYNPVFVERVAETAWALADDPARIARTRDAFDNQLRQQALTYLLVYEAIHRDPTWYAQFKQDYARELEQPGARFVRWEDLGRLNDAFAGAGMSWYETDTAATFWVRRDLDGTAALWREAVEALLTAYGVDTRAEPPTIPGR